MKHTKKAIILLLVMGMLMSSITGCSDTASTNSNESSSTETQAVSNAPQDSATESSSLEYPKLANGDVTLTAWFSWPPPLENTSYKTPNDFPFYKNLTAKTGVNFDFTVVSMSAASEQFSLMVASGTYPDIICDPSQYTGGDDSAIENGVFKELNDLIDQYCPNYKSVISRDDVRRDVYSDSGKVAAFWEIAKEAYPANSGLVIRQDWLDKLGLETPTTYDELYNILTKFKSEFNAESPICINGESLFTPLTAGYNFESGFINIDGTAIFSASADGFKDYLTMMNKWYSEGLIYTDYYTLTENAQVDDSRKKLVESDQTGVWYNWCEDLANYSPTNSAFSLTAITNPVQNEGDVNHICGGIDPIVNRAGGWAISGSCSDDKAIIAAKLIDYFYSEEGSIFANWGIEGDTFTYQEDGTPRYTDVILENKELGTNMAIATYCVFRGPILSDLNRFNQNVVGKLKEYCDVWGVQTDDYNMPSVSLTTEEQERYSSIYSDIDTLIDENISKFIIGDRSLSEFDSFMEELRSVGLNEMVEIEQGVLDRYMAR